MQVIRENNPATVLQFYLTWGRPYGEQQLCQTMEQFCSYETMQVGSQQLTVTPPTVIYFRTLSLRGTRVLPASTHPPGRPLSERHSGG